MLAVNEMRRNSLKSVPFNAGFPKCWLKSVESSPFKWGFRKSWLKSANTVTTGIM